MNIKKGDYLNIESLTNKQINEIVDYLKNKKYYIDFDINLINKSKFIFIKGQCIRISKGMHDKKNKRELYYSQLVIEKKIKNF